MTVAPEQAGRSAPAGAPGGAAGDRRPADGRFPCLDGLRALAACAVVVHHVSSATGTNTAVWPGWFFARMDAGVPVFFLLSGFLLYRPYVGAHLAGRPRPATVPYLWRRGLRILPAYWIALTGAWLVLGTVHFHDVGDALWSYGLAQIYSKAHVLDGLVQAWSLATEVAFYLFLPLYALAVRAAAARTARPVAVELGGAVLLVVTGLTVHATLLATHAAATPATLWLPAQLDLFGLGIGLAVVHAWSAREGRVPAPFAAAGRHAAACWIAAGVCFTVASTALGLPRVFGDLTGRQEMSRQVFYAATAFFLLLPGVFGPQDRGAVRRFLRSTVVVWLGTVSYGIFLWHKDVLNWWLDRGALGWVTSARFLSLLALTAGPTLVVAAVSWYAAERPILRLKGRVPDRRRAVPAPTS